jgi:hypothetical protein
MKAKRWTLGLLGIWLIVAAFLGFGTTAHLWNDVIVGALVALVSLTGERGAWAWLAGIAGIWMIVAGFIPAFLAGAGLIWNNLIVGALIGVAGLALGSQQASPSTAH